MNKNTNKNNNEGHRKKRLAVITASGGYYSVAIRLFPWGALEIPLTTCSVNSFYQQKGSQPYYFCIHSQCI